MKGCRIFCLFLKAFLFPFFLYWLSFFSLARAAHTNHHPTLRAPPPPRAFMPRASPPRSAVFKVVVRGWFICVYVCFFFLSANQRGFGCRRCEQKMRRGRRRRPAPVASRLPQRGLSRPACRTGLRSAPAADVRIASPPAQPHRLCNSWETCLNISWRLRMRGLKSTCSGG